MISNNRMITIILATVLALSLLLTACSNGGDTLTGDNTTPVASSTSDRENTFTPDISSTPAGTDSTDGDNTPSTDNSDIPFNELVIDEDSFTINTEKKAEIDEDIGVINNARNIDIDEIINEIFDEYGKFLNVNITKNAIRVAIIVGSVSPYYSSHSNITGISPNALNDVNEFLAGKGEEQLDVTIPKQGIAALWIAASLKFDPDCDNPYDVPYWFMAMPFGLVRADSSEYSALIQANNFISHYLDLFNLR